MSALRSPSASVIVPAFRARQRIDAALASLNRQSYRGTFEIIVVASGDDGCAEHVRLRHPAVRVVASPERLWPGAARNAGLRAARGDVIAFIPADGEATERWLERRVALHDRGADLVGGSIVNGSPWHPVACAEYLLEYSALMPIQRLLEAQAIPHAVSFKRTVFDLIGSYPEDTETGEDTLFNRRCLQAGMSVAYAPQATLIHRGNRSLLAMWRHAYAHGRGLAQCVDRHRLSSAVGPLGQWPAVAACRMLVLYPVAGAWAKLRRLARFSPQHLLALLVLAPLVLSGLIATGSGAWSHYRQLRHSR